jgi:hypothetical protein
VKGRLALRARKQVHAVAEGIVGEGLEDVTVAGPGGFLRIDASGITIAGTLVKINVSGSPGKGPGSKPEVPDDVEPQKIPSIFNLRWSAAKVRIGKPVKAIFTVKGFERDETALVKVFECNVDGTKKQIDEVHVPVKTTRGDVAVPWVRTPDQAEGDLLEDERQGDISPLDYRFEVETGSVRSDRASKTLRLTNTVVIEVLDGDKPAKDGAKVTITTAEGKKKARSKGGRAVFDNVLVGPLKIDFE